MRWKILLFVIVFLLLESIIFWGLVHWMGFSLVLVLGLASLVLGIIVLGKNPLSRSRISQILGSSSLDASDSLLCAMSGILFVLPGFLSSIVASFLLLKPVRRVFIGFIQRFIQRRLRKGQANLLSSDWLAHDLLNSSGVSQEGRSREAQRVQNVETIDVEYEVKS